VRCRPTCRSTHLSLCWPQALKKVIHADPLVQVSTSENGEHIIAGSSELHLEVILHELERNFLPDVPLKVSRPVVSFCESVARKSDFVCIGAQAARAALRCPAC
jgi:translation elongation factor EF-G